ncbi:histidine phosphatase family protein [Desulfoluna spongiiphila]|uniref:Probable phosphoglycerate mutase n=1 Tax=Desulfoluna spongiiphila TaxID=419481 RepID=A0A1G5FX89_9BACT|nr:histidine phosphatase family protein [Desulfoluna spongiiphila]SCY43784.1 probable phosphoglycerate mutase [Desulfoluna spongiiphila]
MITLPFHTNRYFILRHGHSTANEKGLIVSSPEHGIGNWGLSETGKEEVTRSMTRAADEGLFNPMIKPVVVCSPFLRALETASIAAKILKAERFPDSNLRERFFGEFDLKESALYEKGWTQDETNPDHTEFGVESVNAVAARMVEVIKRTGQRYNEKDIILVTHGDPGQILQCVFDGIDPAKHRSIEPLQTAELRAIPSR